MMLLSLPIETERLILRDFREDDWVSIHRYASDPENTKYCSFGPNTEEQTAGFLRRTIENQKQDPRDNWEFAVVRKSDNELIGASGILIKDRPNRAGEIGYVFHKDFWGQGYASEVVRKLLEVAFGPLSLHRVFAYIFSENAASIRVVEKAGFILEGHIREDFWKKGRWNDVLIYAILDHEWQALRSGKTL